MNISKDPKIINFKVIDKKTGKIVGFDIGPTLGEIEGNMSYEGIIAAMEKGQQYQIQAYDSGDPANVTVKDINGEKVIVSGRDNNPLNNIKGLKERYVNEEKVTEETSKEAKK